MWEGMDQPLPDGNWPLVSASGLPYKEGVNQTPSSLDRAGMDAVVADFVSAAQRAAAAGFDLLELHCAHGYLLSSFLSPVTNRRADDYGGDVGHRLRFPLEVFAAVREVWPAERPMTVRISATDWVEGGVTLEDTLEVARAFEAAGAAAIDVSTGQVTPDERPAFGRSYQTPYADAIRNSLHIPTIAVGVISSADDVNTIVLSGRADLCARWAGSTSTSPTGPSTPRSSRTTTDPACAGRRRGSRVAASRRPDAPTVRSRGSS